MCFRIVAQALESRFKPLFHSQESTYTPRVLASNYNNFERFDWAQSRRALARSGKEALVSLLNVSFTLNMRTTVRQSFALAGKFTLCLFCRVYPALCYYPLIVAALGRIFLI